jgi:AcrR family transcriptional regulator
MTAPTRDHLLAAAARLYGEHGYRGTTTRRIAEEAGVNEVTLFRLFGNKTALLEEAIREHSQLHTVPLPGVPQDPERELVKWATAEHRGLTTCRSMIRKAMAEMEERRAPECMAQGPTGAGMMLRGYIERLEEHGFVARGQDATAASAMLMGTLFADAMGRDLMPAMFPHPVASALAAYVRLFLRGLGCEAAKSRRGGPRSRRAS